MQTPTGSMVLHLKDPLTGKDHWVLISDIQTGQSYPTWLPGEEYEISQRVTYGFKLFESLQDENEGNVPSGSVGDLFWKEVSESSKPDKLERVIAYDAHPFAVNDVLTLDEDGLLVKITDPSEDKFIGVVNEVINANNFRLVITGYVTGLSGLTAGLKYYAQDDGTLGTDETDMPVLKADSSTSGYLLSSGAGGSGMAIENTYPNIAGLLAAQADQRENKWYAVQDASADATVDTGWAIYQYLGTTVGNLTDYLKVAEQESLDVVINNGSETVKGIFEEATDAETAAGTAVGGTGAKLVVTPAKLITWWTNIKAGALSIAGLWTFAKAKLTHGAFGFTALVDAANIAWNADTIGNIAQVTLGGNRTLDAITNPQAGGIYVLRVVQDGTGSRTLAFNAAYTFPNGITPVLNSAIAAVTVYQFFYDGANFRYMNNNGAIRVTDVLLNNQIQSGKKVGLFIDTDGTVKKVGEAEYNTTNKSWTFTGVDNSASTVSYEWLNQSLARIFAIFNDQHVEVGGSTSYMKVGSTVASGDAKLEFLDNKALAYILGTSSQNFIEFVTTTGGHKIRLKVDLEHDSNGSTYIQIHYETTTGTTASATTTIGAFPIPVGKMATIWSSWNVTETGGISGGGEVTHTLKNLAGTTSEIGAATAVHRRSAGDFVFDINADDVNDTIDFDFTNSSGPNNKAYKVNIHAEIHLTNIAV